MIVKVWKWKKLQIILVLISEFFVVSQLNYFVLKVLDLKPFNDIWRKEVWAITGTEET
jgi:hypothetical protein